MPKFQPYKKSLLSNEKIVISIRLDESKLANIDDIASKVDISRNELINQCIEYALNNIEFNDTKKDDKKKDN